MRETVGNCDCACVRACVRACVLCVCGVCVGAGVLGSVEETGKTAKAEA